MTRLVWLCIYYAQTRHERRAPLETISSSSGMREIIFVDRARCCWFHGSLKCILLRISMIIRQLGDWLKRAPGGRSETSGKAILVVTHWGATNVSSLCDTIRRTLFQQTFVADEKKLLFGVLYIFSVKEIKPDLGVIVHADENRLPDYTFSVWLLSNTFSQHGQQTRVHPAQLHY